MQRPPSPGLSEAVAPGLRPEGAERLLDLLRTEDALLAEMAVHLGRDGAAPSVLDPAAAAETRDRLAPLLGRLAVLEHDRIALTGEGPSAFSAATAALPAPLRRDLQSARNSLILRRDLVRAAASRQARAAAHVAAFARSLSEELARRGGVPAYGPSGAREQPAESGRLVRTAL